MKARILSLALACSLSVFAQQAKTKQCEPECCEKKPVCCTPKCLKNCICLNETFDNDGVNLGARADVLYMNYTSPVLTYASEESATAPGILHSNILSVPGRMSVGCNIAIMYRMPNQPGYSFESSWYHIVSKFNRSVSSNNIVPSHIVATNNHAPGTAKVNAHIAINFFDLMIMKQFAFGDWFSVTPAAGLVGGFMDSVNTANFHADSGTFGSLTTISQLKQTLKYEGIGLKLGGRSSFKIGCGFRLMTEFFYNVLYGFSKDKLAYTSNGAFTGVFAAGLNSANVSYNNHHGRCFFDSLLGLAWETRFSCDTMYLDLHAGWRFQTFSSGWMEFEAEQNDSLHDLALYGQGLQAGATFKF